MRRRRLFASFDADSQSLGAEHVLVESLYGGHCVLPPFEHHKAVAGRLASDGIDRQPTLQDRTVRKEQVAQLHVGSEREVVHVQIATVAVVSRRDRVGQRGQQGSGSGSGSGGGSGRGGRSSSGRFGVFSAIATRRGIIDAIECRISHSLTLSLTH